MLRSDWAAVLDNWAVRFFHEMDYQLEARNAARFARDMRDLKGIKARPLARPWRKSTNDRSMGGSQVPRMYDELCSRRVLTGEWVVGEKLSESNAADVRQLCDTLLNCYLIQLLDTGFLHAGGCLGLRGQASVPK